MKTNTLYDHIRLGYNSTRKADSFITERLFQLLAPRSNNLYLDIGCGTGNYTIALANKGLRFYGLEPSEEMLSTARQKNDEINWLRGNAEKIPLIDNVFDGAIATLTIHHWVNLKKAFKEIARVVKPGGPVIIFTALPEQMQYFWLNYYFPMMLRNSITQMPGYYEIEAAALEADLSIKKTESYFIQDNLEDHFLYVGKNRPELYFNEYVRKGISSFAALANKDEVEAGLSSLAADLANNEFNTVKEIYESHLGDYIFITLQNKRQLKPLEQCIAFFRKLITER